jgi:hypothetical protein
MVTPSRVARPSTKQNTIGSFPLKLGIRCKEFGSAPYIGFEDPKSAKDVSAGSLSMSAVSLMQPQARLTRPSPPPADRGYRREGA